MTTGKAPVGSRLEFFLACCAVFLSPMNVLRLPLFYFTAGDLFACLCIGVMLLNGRVRVAPFGSSTVLWTGGLLLMVGMLMTSSVFAGSTGRALILIMQYLFSYLLLPMVFLNRPWDETRRLMLVFIAAISVLVLHGILVVDVLYEHDTHFVSGNGRLRGLVERENECGALISLTVPMLLSLTLAGSVKPIVSVVLLGLFTYGIMLTGSNTALYTAAFGLVLVIAASVSLKRLIIVATAACLLFGMASVPNVSSMLPGAFRTRVLVGLETGDLQNAGTFDGRMQLIREAVGLAGNATIIGYGADQYRVISRYKAPVHNFYLLILDEGGLAALVGFIALLFGAILVVINAALSAGGTLAALCGGTTLAVYAVLITAVPHIYGRFWAVPLLLSLAPAVACARRVRIA
ncbi:O-antigen ligase family protein [Pararhizobium mangrovi]|uniref:O-antigen ligase family protein n=1 Tax=Pararhizobium mangrovi TaxID=2590452 RepID=A0A506U7R0_9HYPH|nr:O-antigen ligase family protein [Pararhizobium mangrovi]TPW28995.1 O-antigen ligase family protein [Pararhizobium mangrovi]